MAKEFETLQRQFAKSIRYPSAPIEGELSSVEERRLKIYRELFFNNVEGFISGTFPVLKSLVNEHTWLKLVRLFFQQHQAETPYFLEISEEFLAFLQQHLASFSEHEIQLPAYALELAHWEWMELLADRTDTSVDAVSHTFNNKMAEIDISAYYTIVETAWGVSYQYPVHKAAPGVELSPSPTCLIIYRNTQDLVGFVEVNPMSLALFDALKNNQNTSLKDVLSDIAKQQGMDADLVINGGLQIAEQWQALGILRLEIDL